MFTFTEDGVVSGGRPQIVGHLLHLEPVHVQLVDAVLHVLGDVGSDLAAADRQVPVRFVQPIHVTLTRPQCLLHRLEAKVSGENFHKSCVYISGC